MWEFYIFICLGMKWFSFLFFVYLKIIDKVGFNRSLCDLNMLFI